MERLCSLEQVRRLIAIAEQHGLEALDVAAEEGVVSIVTSPGRMIAQPLVTAAPLATVDSAGDVAETRGVPLCSPITGVFYLSPSPGEPPFVQIGDAVDGEDPVCLIEAMKIFNEIPAGIAGRVVRIVAVNEQVVNTGDVLIEFEPREQAS